MQLVRSENENAVAHSVRPTELARIADWPSVQRSSGGAADALQLSWPRAEPAHGRAVLFNVPHAAG